MMSETEIMRLLNTTETKLCRTEREIGPGLDRGVEGGLVITLELNKPGVEDGNYASTYGYANVVKWRGADGTYAPCRIDWSGPTDHADGEEYNHTDRVGVSRTTQFAALLLKAAEVAANFDRAYPPTERTTA